MDWPATWYTCIYDSSSSTIISCLWQRIDQETDFLSCLLKRTVKPCIFRFEYPDNVQNYWISLKCPKMSMKWSDHSRVTNGIMICGESIEWDWPLLFLVRKLKWIWIIWRCVCVCVQLSNVTMWSDQNQ